MRTLEIEQKIKEILVHDLEIQHSLLIDATAATPLLGRGIGLDSMETLTLVTGLEREFDFQVDDEELNAELFQTLGSVTDFVIRKKAENDRGK
jgi:acyl carrier protein